MNEEPERTIDRLTPAAGSQMTDAEYSAATTERSQHARARGLSAPYIAGGEDPDPERTRREERRYLRLLILMVGLIVGGGLLLTIVSIVSNLAAK